MIRKIIFLLSFIFVFALNSCINNEGNNQDNNEHIHSLNHYDYVEATCLEDGQFEFWQCNICGKYFSDKEGLNEISETVIKSPGHKWDNWVIDIDATCEKEGSKHHSCLACGEEEIEVIDALGHKLINRQIDNEEECTSVLQADYFECERCHKFYLDEDTLEEISLEDTFSKPKGHSFSDYEVIEEATCLTDGKKKRTCECGTEEIEIISALGHNIENNICLRCQIKATENLLFEPVVVDEEIVAYICAGFIDDSSISDELIIPDIYEGKPVIEVKEDSFSNTGIKSLTLSKTIERIGDRAFAYCDNLSKVFFTDDLKNIGSESFAYCNLEEVNFNDDYVTLEKTSFAGNDIKKAKMYGSEFMLAALPISIEELHIIGGNVIDLSDYYNLKKLILSDINEIYNGSLNSLKLLEFTEYGNAYYLGNEDNRYEVLVKAKSIDIKYATVHVDTKIIAYDAFKNCKDLLKVEFIEKSKLKEVGVSAFENCESLKEANFVFNYDGLWKIAERAFYNCINLEHVNFPITLSHIGKQAFANCKSLKEAIFPINMDEILEETFSNCESLEILNLKYIEEVADNAFYNCNNIRKLTIPLNGYYDKIYIKNLEDLTITGGFDDTLPKIIDYGMYNLKKIHVCGDVKIIGDGAFDVDNRGIEEVILDEGIEKIGFAAFRGIGAKVINIPASVKFIQELAFERGGIETINVAEGNLYFESLNGVLFTKGLNKLICYPSGKKDKEYILPDSVYQLGNRAFSDWNDNLKKLIIGENLRKPEEWYGAFKGLRAIEEYECSPNNPFLTSKEGVLYSKDLTKVIAYPAGRKYVKLDEKATEILNYAFSNLDLYVEGDENPILDLSETNIKIINANAFDSARFESIKLPNNLEILKGSALSSMTTTTNVYMPNTVKEIEEWIFSTSFNLKNIYYNGTVEEWNNILKHESWSSNVRQQFKVICTDGELIISDVD